jgi:diaminopimelate decarboxylase
MNLTPFSAITSEHVLLAAEQFDTPLYLYDESLIEKRCKSLMAMPNAFGLEVCYAMKANPSRALLQIISRLGLGVDASSVNEAERARHAGIPYDQMMLTTQDVPVGADRTTLEQMLREGMTYNICSQRQLEQVLPFLGNCAAKVAIRVSPGVGAGESITRNTGDKYSSFGIHLTQLDGIKQLLASVNVKVQHVHAHIGSGGEPRVWRANIDRMLQIVEQHFPEAQVVNLGGGFKEARMPDETAADIQDLGSYVRQRFAEFQAKTGRALKAAIEPGTFVVANAGFLVTRVLDIKTSGPDGFEFIILNAGMESSTRPLLYGSRHPFYVVSASGQLLSSEFDATASKGPARPCVVVGRCCESGDSQTLDDQGHVVPRKLAVPKPGDFLVVGGVGAYCSAMSLVNYNSYQQPPEILLRPSGNMALIRRRQTFEQMVINEMSLDEV